MTNANVLVYLLQQALNCCFMIKSNVLKRYYLIPEPAFKKYAVFVKAKHNKIRPSLALRHCFVTTDQKRQPLTSLPQEYFDEKYLISPITLKTTKSTPIIALGRFGKDNLTRQNIININPLFNVSWGL